MEVSNTLSNNVSMDNSLIEKNQNSFLKSSLWNVINTGLNIGIRALLPNFVEDQVIEIKDALINSGFKDGINNAISGAIDLGKKALGIVTGGFENISQAQNAIKSGGLMDSISNVFNSAVNVATKNNLINNDTSKSLKKGKEKIKNTIESNIESNFNDQLSAVEKINKYSENWKQFFENKDFKNMEKEYKKIKQNLKETLPMENTLKQARQIENLHLLIKNNGHNFDLSPEELQLAEKLVS